jgi:hypothetical protein
MTKRPVLFVLAALLALALAPSALAATPPAATTGAARDVVSQSATLVGSVNPHGSPTSYFFQYGLSKSYGARTENLSAGAGGARVPVLVPIPRPGQPLLRPDTTYHFRIVAFSPAGTQRGADRTFHTPKLPVIVTVAPSLNPVPFGASTLITGHVANAPAGVPVVLQQRVFPYTGPFTNVGNALLTDAAGNFAFGPLILPVATQFQVVKTTKPVATSAIINEQVAVVVSIHHKARRLRRGALVRFYGATTPAHDGALYAIQRRSGSRWVTVRGASLHHRSRSSSSYSLRVRIRHSGTYRTFVQVVDGNHTSGASPSLAVRIPRR